MFVYEKPFFFSFMKKVKVIRKRMITFAPPLTYIRMTGKKTGIENFHYVLAFKAAKQAIKGRNAGCIQEIEVESPKKNS